MPPNQWGLMGSLSKTLLNIAKELFYSSASHLFASEQLFHSHLF